MPLDVKLRRTIRHADQRRLISEPPAGGEITPRTGVSEAIAAIPSNELPEGTARPPEMGEVVIAPADNPDPLKQRIQEYPKRPGRVARLVRELRETIHPTPTQEEVAMREENLRRKQLEKTLRAEADLFMDRVVNALTRRELCYRNPKTQRDMLQPRVYSVRFDCVVLQPEALYLRVDMYHLPRGVGVLMLTEPDVLTDLSLACGRRVTAEYNERVGCWFIVERATGVRGIPSHVKYTDMLNGYPATADGLSIPLGMGTNSRPIYQSLGRIYSLLVAGTVGAGKSNFLNTVLCTLIRRNSPARLQLILIDLKGGMEFTFYGGVPHLIPIPGVTDTGIATDRKQVAGVFTWLMAEGERRMKVILDAGHKSIGRYNAQRKKDVLSHIVLMIDEWSDVMYDKSISKDAEEALANIASRFRAVGVHVILCTQVPKAEVISTRIKGVIPAKLAFSCPSNPSSMVILDNGAAKGLFPEGRAIFQWERGDLEIQTPYIHEGIIDETIKGAITGHYEDTTAPHDVTELEVMEFALRELNGYLSREKLFTTFGKRGLTKQELSDWLSKWEGQSFVIGSSEFIVTPPAGQRSRRLVAVDESKSASNPPDEKSGQQSAGNKT